MHKTIKIILAVLIARLILFGEMLINKKGAVKGRLLKK